MTYEQWIEMVEKLRKDYIEETISAKEYFRAVMFYGTNVEQNNG